MMQGIQILTSTSSLSVVRLTRYRVMLCHARFRRSPKIRNFSRNKNAKRHNLHSSDNTVSTLRSQSTIEHRALNIYNSTPDPTHIRVQLNPVKQQQQNKQWND
jgi:hypothetical protein